MNGQTDTLIYDVAEMGRAIKKRRETLGYTQSFVSRHTGLSISFISEVENGKETAQIAKVMKLLLSLGLDLRLTER